jgi:hypothetical protein
MDHLNWYDYVRLATTILALISMGNLVWQARKNWNVYSSRNKDVWWLLMSCMFVIGSANLEQVIQDVGIGCRTFASFVITAVCAATTTVRRDDLI